MTKKNSIIITSIISVVFVTLLSLTIWWTAANWGLIMKRLDGVKLATQEDVVDAREDGRSEGYNQALADKLEMEKQLAQYFAELTELNKIVPTLIAQNESMSAQLAVVYAQIADLLAQINYYQGLLNDSGITPLQLTVSFVDDDKLIKFQTVEKNGYASAPKEGLNTETHIFLYWSIDGQNEVDVSSYQVTQNTVFIGIYRERIWKTIATIDAMTPAVISSVTIDENGHEYIINTLFFNVAGIGFSSPMIINIGSVDLQANQNGKILEQNFSQSTHNSFGNANKSSWQFDSRYPSPNNSKQVRLSTSGVYYSIDLRLSVEGTSSDGFCLISKAASNFITSLVRLNNVSIKQFC